jgi:hypothetical protein
MAQFDHWLAGIDDGGHLAEPLLGLGRGRAGAVDERCRVRVTEEPGRRVQIAPAGYGDLGRRVAQSAGDPVGPALGRAHPEAGVVQPHGAGPDQDRVAARPLRVDPVEVGLIGQQKPFVVGVVQVAVEGHAAAEQNVGGIGGRHAGFFVERMVERSRVWAARVALVVR